METGILTGRLDKKLWLGRMRNQLIVDMEELEGGDTRLLSNVYFAFAAENKGLTARAGRLIAQVMSHMTAGQLLKLEEEFRQKTSVEWFADWRCMDLAGLKKDFEEEEHYDWALRLGTFHPNGYFREACVKNLQGREGSLPYLLLRLNDWVGNVRVIAAENSVLRLERCPPEELFFSMPFLEKAGRGGRRADESFQRIAGRVSELLMEQLELIPLYQIKRWALPVRRALYRQLFFGKAAELETAEQLLAQEPDSYCKRILFRGILENYHLDREQTARYFINKSAVVRRMAVEYRYDLEKESWDGLEQLLLDPARAVRDMAAFILRKHTELNIPDFYINALSEGRSCEQAVAGLSENGGEAHAWFVLPYAESGQSRIAAAAVKALGRLWGAEGAEIYWKKLFDKSPSVAKAAFQTARTCRVRYGAAVIYRAIQSLPEDSESTRSFLVRLLLEENSWDRLPYLLKLYNEEDGKLCWRIRKKAEERYIYGNVSAARAEEIKRILDDPQLQIPAKLKDEILFDLKYVAKGT